MVHRAKEGWIAKKILTSKKNLGGLGRIFKAVYDKDISPDGNANGDGDNDDDGDDDDDDGDDEIN